MAGITFSGLTISSGGLTAAPAPFYGAFTSSPASPVTGNVVTVSAIINCAIGQTYNMYVDYKNSSQVASATGTVSATPQTITTTFTANYSLQPYSSTFKVTELPIENLSITISPPPSKLYSWGLNSLGQLGLGDTTDRSTPVQIGSDTTWSTVATCIGATTAVKQNGTLWNWGSNSPGNQLADLANHSTPAQVGTDTNWTLITGSRYGWNALKASNIRYYWGYSRYNELGTGADEGGQSTFYSTPAQVGGTSAAWTWTTVIESAAWGAGIRSTGTLWAWGKGLYSGANYGSPNPVQIQAGGSGYSDFTQVAGGYDYLLAIRSNGTLWTIGSNGYGQCGTNNTTPHSSDNTSLVQVGTDTNWTLVACIGYSSLAIRSDGTLWSWSRNVFGQLGQGDTTGRSSPTQVGALTTWSILPVFVEGNTPNTVPSGAIRSDGTLWTWGYNANGQLGDGTTTTRSSPVQVGSGTGWSSVTMGPGSFTIGISS